MLLVSWAAGPAVATPPDIIEVHDELLGINETHVFVLRVTHDNMGLYVSGKNDIYLVAKNIETGLDETFWPVYRTDRFPDYQNDESGLTEKLEVEPLQDAVNPYDILAVHDALPIAATYFFNRADVDGEPSTDMTSDALSISQDGAVEYQISTQALLDQIDVSMKGLRDALQTYDRFAPVDTRDVLYGGPFGFDDCSVQESRRAQYLIQTDPVQLARVVCDIEDGFAPASLYVIVPPIRQ